MKDNPSFEEEIVLVESNADDLFKPRLPTPAVNIVQQHCSVLSSGKRLKDGAYQLTIFLPRCLIMQEL